MLCPVVHCAIHKGESLQSAHHSLTSGKERQGGVNPSQTGFHHHCYPQVGMSKQTLNICATGLACCHCHLIVLPYHPGRQVLSVQAWWSLPICQTCNMHVSILHVLFWVSQLIVAETSEFFVTNFHYFVKYHLRRSWKKMFSQCRMWLWVKILHQNLKMKKTMGETWSVPLIFMKDIPLPVL